MSHKTIKIALLAALALVLAISTTALADAFASYRDWTGQGSGSMDCSKVGQGPRTEDGWIHWIVTSAKDVTAAQLVLSGTGTGTYAPNKMGSVIEFFTPYYKIDGLMARLYYNGKLGKNSQFVISDYCPVVYKPLTATKTAYGTYERKVEWKLDKTVDDDYHEGWAGQEAGKSEWKITITKTETLGKYLVTGEITITNPNKIAVDFKVDDMLDDGTLAVVTCPAYTVPAFGSITCTYAAKPSGGTATKNTAVVTALTPYVTGATAVKDFTYKETLVGYDAGLLSDPRFKYEEEISGSVYVTFEEKFTCSDKASDYTKGFYSYTVENVAILDSNIGLEDSATVTVDCYLPALKVEKTAAGTWERDVKWSLDKSVDKDYFKGGPGDVFDATWTVAATKTVIGPKNFVVSGDITITNPAGIPQTFTLKDVLDDGTEAVVTCPAYTVPAGGTVVCTYEAKPIDASAKLNTVKVTAPGNDPVTATAKIDWTEKLTGYDEGTLKDPRFTYEKVIGASTTVTFPETFTCSEDLTKYTNGYYTYTEENVAILDSNIGLKDSATVTVECYLKFYGETAWASNGNTPGELRYVDSNWATYVAYAPKTVTLFAGQTMPAGTVTFSAPDLVTGKVTITLNLTGAWVFDPFKGVTLHVQDYANAPIGINPAPGQFAYTAACSGQTCTIVVPLNNFYGVHANVGYWGK